MVQSTQNNLGLYKNGQLREILRIFVHPPCYRLKCEDSVNGGYWRLFAGPARDFMRTMAKAVKSSNLSYLTTPTNVPPELIAFITSGNRVETNGAVAGGGSDETPAPPSFSDYSEKIVNLPVEDGTTYLLHLAAASADAGASDTIAVLLELGADPSAKDGRGRVPYVLASEKANRNAFRRFMGQQPDR